MLQILQLFGVLLYIIIVFKFVLPAITAALEEVGWLEPIDDDEN